MKTKLDLIENSKYNNKYIYKMNIVKQRLFNIK